MNKRSLILSLLSGVLLVLSFPKFGIGLVAWIALVPLFHAIRELDPGEAFLNGFLAGCVFNIGLFYWVVHVVVHYGDLPLYTAIPIMLLMAFYLALYVSVFAAGTAYFRGKGISEIVSAPLLWIALEYAKSYFVTGFPWENLAASQYAFVPFIQIADITGMYGISFFIVLVNAVLFAALIRQRARTLVPAVGITLLLGILIIGYGYSRMNAVDDRVHKAKLIPISLIQGNIDQSIKWNPQFQMRTLDIYRSLSFEAAKEEKGRLIVWPETAAPFFFQDNDHRHRAIRNIAVKTRSHLLFGAPSYGREEGAYFLRNSAYLIRPDGSMAGRYDKVHLVPFGEYVPLKKYLFFVDRLVEGVGNFMPGAGFEPLMIDGNKAGVLICYEGVFPEISREYRKRGASLLINVTNDAWYGRTSAPYQHMSMLAFRAVENRLFIARAANTGISAMIDPAGRIMTKSGLFERTYLNGNIAFLEGGTFYSRYGDVFTYCCLGFLLVICLTALRLKKE
ncbi:MAG: apolipoprotein N-acyltransferase [Deltaproteobacteria bacterium]|nr:apolipoprotein N-acyltransferase [Deltaproteobacteria bacterium]